MFNLEMKEKKIILLDGATGTQLWEAAEAAGIEKKPVWTYNIDAPQLVKDMHKSYIRAGSNIICTNTFSANIPAVNKEGYNWKSVISKGVGLAKEAAVEFEKEGFEKTKIALDLGPLLSALEPFGDTTEEECREIYFSLCQEGAAAGADLIFLETFMDIDMLLIAAQEAKKTGLPLFCCMSFDKTGKTLYGVSPERMADELEETKPDAIGLNCSYGPEDAVPVMKAFKNATNLPLILKPNTADLAACDFAEAIKPAVDIISFLGACCGSSPKHIEALRGLF